MFLMTYLGNHTMSVQRGINLGVALFIVSEGLFFLAIFWAFFHSACIVDKNQTPGKP
jgi:cytochrome c oxidase subunit 3